MTHRVIFYCPGTHLNGDHDYVILDLPDEALNLLRAALVSGHRYFFYGTLAINLMICPVIDGIETPVPSDAPPT